MVDGKYVVEQAHEIQCTVKELELLKIIVLDEFVAGGIIAKLPPSWERMRVASCVVPLIIGQRSTQIAKEENLNLSRRL
jgi:hypothetical protein